MAILTDLFMFAWIPIVFGLFMALPARRAVIVGILGGFLFLPWAKYRLHGLPEYTKMMALSWGVFGGAAMFDLKDTLYSLRPRWFDIPMVCWCLAPLVTSLSNGLGVYDGLSNMLAHLTDWGVPYLLGRAYFDSFSKLRELAIGFLIAGLIYVPFCLWEIRMSPRLHVILFGFRASDFGSTFRFGGYRPLVFMLHGLMLGFWMSACSLTAYWLWSTGAVKRVGKLSIGWVYLITFATTVACKSLGALALLVYGMVLIRMTRVRFLWVVAASLVFIPVSYIYVRTTDTWTLKRLVTWAGKVDKERAHSLNFRLGNERILVARALERPIFGWGTWGRNRVLNERGRDISVPDGLWVLTLGRNGLFGLLSWLTVALLPVILFAYRYPPWFWHRKAVAPAAALTVIVGIFAIDCLLNAMINPAFSLASGGLLSVAGTRSRQQQREHEERLLREQRFDRQLA